MSRFLVRAFLVVGYFPQEIYSMIALRIFIAMVWTAVGAAEQNSPLDGLWTTIPKIILPLHDALRIGGSSVTCEDGGTSNMTKIDCHYSDPAAVTVDAFLNVLVAYKDDENMIGSFIQISNDCDWVSAAPGAYWTAASEFAPPFTPECSVIKFTNGEVSER
jgi:hypothetical protein